MPPEPAPSSSPVRWIPLQAALHEFATFSGATQSQAHIRPLHWHVASRLVVEGGFAPDDITPRPPFRVERSGSEAILHLKPALAQPGERTILGGLKTKAVDVVVTKPGIGPVLAVSCKGMTGALRNLTNRMEELIGECTNLHITYPALVFGFFFTVRANRAEATQAEAAVSDEARSVKVNDIAFLASGNPVGTLVRFHNALREITGRRGIRNDVSRYEAVALCAVEPAGVRAGGLLADFPAEDSSLRIERFFPTLYRLYDERYVFGAPDLRKTTERLVWSPASPAIAALGLEGLGYEPRLGTAEA